MVTARPPKGTLFVQPHLFSGLTSFSGLESKIAALPDEQSRGAAFEVFAEAYLATQRKHDAAQVWPHGSVPLRMDYFVGRFPRVVRSSQPQANFRSAFSAFEFAAIREIRVKVFCFRFDTSP